MDETYLQLLELVRAGWAFSLDPESDAPTLGASQLAITWSRQPTGAELETEQVPVPYVDWISPFSPSDLKRAIAKQHAIVFPISPFGDLPATLA